MRSVSLIMGRFFLPVLVTGCFFLNAKAQENSPFTRYGLGDVSPGSHSISRSMGGITAAYADGQVNNVGQAINFGNPATYGNFFMVSYDLGLTIDSRTLRSANPSDKFTSNNFYPTYVAFGAPIKSKKNLGFAFGLRPASKISYSVVERTRIANDSLGTVYEGTGGLNQLFVGLGKRWKGFSIGFNTGYNFGRREISTKKTFLNDTVFYYQSNSATISNFGGVFLHSGFQYDFSIAESVNSLTKVTNKYWIRLGATATLSQQLKATQTTTRETFTQSQAGDLTIDSIYKVVDLPGTIEIPATYTAGITLHKTAGNNRGLFELWSLGAEYTSTQWTKYRYYNQPDRLSNSWQFRVGAQICPDPVAGRNYWSNVNYRAGFFVGEDYVNPDGNGLKQFGFSMGMGLPIKKWNAYDRQFTVLNTTVQFGKRGSNVNNFTESYAQFTIGFSLSDLWFQKRKYD